MTNEKTDSIETVLANAARNSREVFDWILAEMPEEVAVLRLLRSAALNAAQIHCEILNPDHDHPRQGEFTGPLNLPPSCDSERRWFFMVSFVDLGNALALAEPLYYKFRDQYAEDALHDQPIDRWPGESGDPAEIALHYAEKIHKLLLEMMLPQGDNLSDEEIRDYEALTRRVRLRDGTGLPADVLVRCAAGVPLNGESLGDRPSEENVNTLRGRLERLSIIARQRIREAGEETDEAEKDTENRKQRRLCTPTLAPEILTATVTLKYAADSWFELDERQLRDLINNGRVAAERVHHRGFRFDMREVKRWNPKADCGEGPDQRAGAS